ncbi:PilZ domain-containing protein [Bergeriella denitrificans]|uniref:Type 4 pilus biogenesis protein n=1 Tax=Bergeriella denitrificans TaxID=494 RepID=A0A378UFS2_BERDE|nr:PilZ domain-containing protein [Bergeriella denitrificans]STZ75603.1 type 4 pilus biogenesis protein [Bergeriella denitrificans]
MMTTPDAPAKTLFLKIEDQAMLYHCYMPFLTHGGLFVPTEDLPDLGDEVFLSVEIGGENHVLPVRAAWINPARTSAQRPRGVGLAFGTQEACQKLKSLIEAELGNDIRSDRLTFTL